MKKIALSGKLGKGKFALVDNDDFEILNKRIWHYGKGGYPATYNAEKHLGPIMMHRIIMNLKKGELADHIDSNPLNNQRKNLRLCTKQQNLMNRRKSVGKSSKYKGVNKVLSKYKDKTYVYWRAVITFNDKYIHIGNFKNEITAANAYDQKAKELFGDFAKLNFQNA